MDDFDKSKEFKKIAYFVNATILATHISLLIAFNYIGIRFMFFFNIFSVAMYFVCFQLIYKKLVQLFMGLLLTEIMVHMIAVTICIGWHAGFPIYSFGLICVVYYTKYIYFSEKHMSYVPAVVAILSITIFIGLRLYTYWIKPKYQIDETILQIFFLANSVLIFALIIIALHNYTKFVILNEDSLHNIADFDELTQIYNRRKMHQVLDKLYKESESGSTSFCITIMDVDNFKHINDNYGHDAGDYVLKTISSVMRKTIYDDAKKNCGYVARWGGDEFLIVQQHGKKGLPVEDCQSMIYNIHETIDSMDFTYEGKRLPVSMTGGFATHIKGSTITETFKAADENLYKGKEQGKNVVIF